ncbi:MAG TPA: YaiO family outer membrane beta-barrel protein [Balneolaceae bacterium]|nr:YaiO family outer membrane beta-barrel protein [Balneolaceae bacterium]
MKNLQKICILGWLLMIIPAIGFAQNKYADIGVDKLFAMARKEAFNGHHEKARELCSIILDRTPSYAGVRILRARTYAWDGKYQKARSDLYTVLKLSPGNKEALKALFDTEYWSDHPKAALSVADKALNRYPTEEPFLVDKTKALIQLKHFKRANETVNILEDVNPSQEDIPSLRSQIGQSSINNTLTASYTFETYSRTYNNTHLGSLQWSRRTSLGSIIGRLNFSRRFETSAIQPEIDWYPRIAEGFYGYLNYGYSGSSIFPEHRAGGELYHSLPYGMEASLGFRYLYFGSSSSVTILTGSLTKYYHNYYFSLRPYITPKSSGISRSVTLTVRRYMGNPNNYLSFSGSFGVSPQEQTYQQVTGDVFTLKSQSLSLGMRQNVRYNLNLLGSLDYSHQELLFSPGDYVNILSFTVGAAVKF